MILKLLFLLLIELMIPVYCLSQKKIDWDIYDLRYQKVAQIRATELSIVNDLVWYKVGQKYGVMDFKKNDLISPRYETIHHYPDGMTSVGIGNCYGMVYRGKEILPLSYSNLFLVDSSGYFRAQKGCSANTEAYIISEYEVHDQIGRLIFRGREGEVNNVFNELTKRQKKQSNDVKRLSNGFTLKLLPADQRYVRKGIYNRKDSLIFSCSKCSISDHLNGRFFINETISNTVNEAYMIDTLGIVKLRDGYSQLYYNPAFNIFFYAKENEKGMIDKNGRQLVLTKTTISNGVQVISEDRFLVSALDESGNKLSTICDSSGTRLFPYTKDNFQILGSNCLVRKTEAGSVFIDKDGKPVFEPYDSVFVIPDFNYQEMVEGVNRARFDPGRDVRNISLLDHDGFLPIVEMPMFSHYGIVTNNKKGIFNIEKRSPERPQYTIVAKVNNDLFALKKNDQWFTLDHQGKLMSYEKSRYINFSGKYILTGD